MASRDNGNSDNGGEFSSGGGAQTALIRGNTFAFKAVRYVDVDGMAMFEGDIVLGTVEEVTRMSDMLRAEMAPGIASGVAITGSQYRWPNCRVPYTIDPDLPNQSRVTDAIAHWEANTNFRFRVRTTEADYVTFRPWSGCSSWIGRRGGQQFLNLAANCSTGNTIHEIGHTIGLWHEQSRQDRDAFVSINWAKIQPGTEDNFAQHITDGDDIGAYDFGSIMHYPRNAFSVDGSDTITPITLVPPGVVIGQRTALSAGDIAAANSLCPVVTTIKEVPTDINTRKEMIWDTRKEMIWDTLKEQIRDPIKLAPLDPITLVENLTTPILPPVVNPAVTTLPAVGGARPFAVVTPQPSGQRDTAGGDLQSAIAQLDAQLQDIAERLAQADATREMLQAQYNEISALLAQLIKEHDQSNG